MASLMVVFTVCLAYLGLILATRWFIIARADHMLIQEHLDRLRVELTLLSSDDRASKILQGVRELIAAAEAKAQKRGAGYVLFWGGAYENSAWYNINDAELLLTRLWTWPQTKARLVSASFQLRAVEGSRHGEALVLAREIDALFNRCGGKQPLQEDPEEARCFLEQSLHLLYRVEGESDQKSRTWNNRITWLILCSLVLIFLLSALVGNPSLFLLGATGGFLSRLGQIRQRKGIVTDYGVYWTTLFISPLIGALAGWAGVLTASVLVKDLLGKALDWPEGGASPTSVTMAAALLLGLSERLFSSVINRQSQDAAKPEVETPTPAEAPPVASAPPPGATPRHAPAR
jgi:hypothetical protein